MFAAAIATGCNCSGCGSEIVLKDPDADGSGAGGAGAFGAGGAGGSEEYDAGDGTTTSGIGPGKFLLDGGNSDGVKLDPQGNVVLDSSEVQLHFAWIANSSAGTVSKFDTKTGKEVGRYVAVVPYQEPWSNTWVANNLRGNESHHPSRTAVDLNGDVWVANRAATVLRGSVTKIANHETSCVDRDRNGRILTSRDLNGDGTISNGSQCTANAPETYDATTNTWTQVCEMIRPANWADPLQYDECILFSTPVGRASPSGDVKARAIAISQGFEGSAGDVWVGLYDERKFLKLNAVTGKQVAVNAAGDMDVPLGFGPYGAAIDRQQRLWAVAPGQGLLALIDTIAGKLIRDDIVPPAGFGSASSYGMCVDGKDRVWLPGMYAGSYAFRYDHPTGMGSVLGTWTRVDLNQATSQLGTKMFRPRGIAADDQGYIWMSSDESASGAPAAQLIAFQGDAPFALKKFNTPTGLVDFIDATNGATSTSIGVGLDSDGNPWINNYSGNVMRVHRDTGAVLRSTSQDPGLYTYSDFTGYQARKFTAPQGTFRHDYTGCGSGTQWKSVSWTAVTNPPTTKVQLYVKVAEAPGGLASTSTTKYGPFDTSDADLVAAGVPKGSYMRVEFVLKSTDLKSTPTLTGFKATWYCGSVIN